MTIDKRCACVCAQHATHDDKDSQRGFCIDNIECDNDIRTQRKWDASKSLCVDQIMYLVDADIYYCESGKFVGVPSTEERCTLTVEVNSVTSDDSKTITGIPVTWWSKGIGPIFAAPDNHMAVFSVGIQMTGTAADPVPCSEAITESTDGQRCYQITHKICCELDNGSAGGGGMGTEGINCADCAPLHSVTQQNPSPESSCSKIVCIGGPPKDVGDGRPAWLLTGKDGNAEAINKRTIQFQNNYPTQTGGLG